MTEEDNDDGGAGRLVRLAPLAEYGSLRSPPAYGLPCAMGGCTAHKTRRFLDFWWRMMIATAAHLDRRIEIGKSA